MESKCILFDLDGTLTDSGPGIINCAIATFHKYGIPIPDDTTLRTIIGPPLRDTFARFGIDDVDGAVTYYRSHYNVTGKFENEPYPGIHELLKRLRADGHRLFVATSKPEHMAVDILEHFGLAPYFEVICGATADGIRDKKSAVIAYVLEQIGTKEPVIMVGDTVFDVEGAAEHGIPTVAVAWGYGVVEDMKKAGAAAVAATAEELYAILNS